MGIKEDIITTVSERVMFGGSAVSVVGGLSSSDWAAFGGLAIGLIGLVYTIYRGERADRRERDRDK